MMSSSVTSKIPDGAGYYDLPFVFDNNNNYLCIPLPLVSRHFCNHLVRLAVRRLV